MNYRESQVLLSVSQLLNYLVTLSVDVRILEREREMEGVREGGREGRREGEGGRVIPASLTSCDLATLIHTATALAILFFLVMVTTYHHI